MDLPGGGKADLRVIVDPRHESVRRELPRITQEAQRRRGGVEARDPNRFARAGRGDARAVPVDAHRCPDADLALAGTQKTRQVHRHRLRKPRREAHGRKDRAPGTSGMAGVEARWHQRHSRL